MESNENEPDNTVPRFLDDLDIIERKRMRLDSRGKERWSLTDKKEDNQVLAEMGVAILDGNLSPDEEHESQNHNPSLENIENRSPNLRTTTYYNKKSLLVHKNSQKPSPLHKNIPSVSKTNVNVKNNENCQIDLTNICKVDENFVKNELNNSIVEKNLVQNFSLSNCSNSECLKGEVLAYDENVNDKSIVSGEEFVSGEEIVSGKKIANKRSSEMEKCGKRAKVGHEEENMASTSQTIDCLSSPHITCSPLPRFHKARSHTQRETTCATKDFKEVFGPIDYEEEFDNFFNDTQIKVDSKSTNENHPIMIPDSNCDFAPDFDISNSNESLELSITELKNQLNKEKMQQNEGIQQSNQSNSATKTNEHQPNSNSKINERQPNLNQSVSTSKINEHQPNSNSKTNESQPNSSLKQSVGTSKVSVDGQKSPNELIQNRLIDNRPVEDDDGFGDFKVSKVSDDGGTFPLSSVDQVFLESGEEDELEQTMVQGDSDGYYGHNEEKECFTARDRSFCTSCDTPNKTVTTPSRHACRPSLGASFSDGSEYDGASFSKLSDEVILSIFQWLPKRTTVRCMHVCRRWRRLAADGRLWARVDLGGRVLPSGALPTLMERHPVVLRLANTQLVEPVLPFPLHADWRVQYLDLSASTVGAKCLTSILAASPCLVRLSLENLTLDRKAEEALGKLTQLRALNLSQASGLELGAWKSLPLLQKLEHLNLAWTRLGEASLQTLGTALPPSLQRLNLAGCRKTLKDDVVSAIVSRCPRLVELDLSDAATISGESMKRVRTLLSLEHLALSRCYMLQLKDYLAIEKCPSLQWVDAFGLLPPLNTAMLQRQLPHIQFNKFMHSSIARPTVGNRRTSIWGLRTRD